jgi:hypothetical protein
MAKIPLFARCASRLSLKVVIVVLFLVAVRNFAKLRALTLEEDDAIEELYFIPHQTTSSSSNNTVAAQEMAAQDIEARRNIQLTDVRVPLKIPTPILLASLPKSGTTSVWKYFMCGGRSASHLFAKINENWSNKSILGTGNLVIGNTISSGLCMQWNSLAGRPLLKGCGDYDVWTDTGYLAYLKQAPACYYPAIEGLEDWYKSYPNSTIMLTTRSVDSWVHSASRWKGGSLVRKWHRCHLTNVDPDNPKRRKPMAQFYEWHVELIREFARKHPSITYIEVALEDPNIASILHAKTGIPSSCWGDCKPETGRCKAQNETSVTK